MLVGRPTRLPEFVCDGVVADQNRIIHRLFWPSTSKRSFFQEGIDDFLALFIHRDSKDREAARAVLFLKLDHPGNFDFARSAPGGPKVHQDHLPIVLRKRDVAIV